jgi:hypothetical protein
MSNAPADIISARYVFQYKILMEHSKGFNGG